jgi:hypothetical protein
MRAVDWALGLVLDGAKATLLFAVASAYDVAGLADTDTIRRVIEIAVLDALGLKNSEARRRTLIAGAPACSRG